MTTITYKALKRLKIGDGYREIGDEVPEAAEWKNLWAYLRGGDLEKVVRPDEQPVQPVAVRASNPVQETTEQLHSEVEQTGVRADERKSAARLRRGISAKKEA